MMNENEFEINCVIFVTSTHVSDRDFCDGCAFNPVDCWMLERPHCTSELRADGHDVIFVEKQP